MHPLFLAVPLFQWRVGSGANTVNRWSVSLPIVATNPFVTIPPKRPPAFQRWVFDSGCTFDACGYRAHIEEAGLDPRNYLRGSGPVQGFLGESQQLPRRAMRLWLFSNVPSLADQPFPVDLGVGMSFRNERAPDSPGCRPVIGMSAMHRA